MHTHKTVRTESVGFACTNPLIGFIISLVALLPENEGQENTALGDLVRPIGSDFGTDSKYRTIKEKNQEEE